MYVIDPAGYGIQLVGRRVFFFGSECGRREEASHGGVRRISRAPIRSRPAPTTTGTGTSTSAPPRRLLGPGLDSRRGRAPPPDCSKRRYHASCEYGNCTALSNTTAHVVSILVEVSSSLKNGKKEWTIFGISVEEFVGELLGVFVVSAALAVAFVWWRRIGYAAFMPTVYHYTSIPQDPAWVQKTVD